MENGVNRESGSLSIYIFVGLSVVFPSSPSAIVHGFKFEAVIFSGILSKWRSITCLAAAVLPPANRAAILIRYPRSSSRWGRSIKRRWLNSYDTLILSIDKKSIDRGGANFVFTYAAAN